jgi:hypothetical protein
LSCGYPPTSMKTTNIEYSQFLGLEIFYYANFFRNFLPKMLKGEKLICPSILQYWKVGNKYVGGKEVLSRAL